MRFRCCFIIWTPDFDRLIRLTADQSQARLIEGGAEYAVLSVERTWLGDRVLCLVAVARLPILSKDMSASFLENMPTRRPELTQKLIDPLSPPENMMLSLFTARVLMMAL